MPDQSAVRRPGSEAHVHASEIQRRVSHHEGSQQLRFLGRHRHDGVPAHPARRRWPDGPFDLAGCEASGVGDQADVVGGWDRQQVEQVMHGPFAAGGDACDIDPADPGERPPSPDRLLGHRQGRKTPAGVGSQRAAPGPTCPQPGGADGDRRDEGHRPPQPSPPGSAMSARPRVRGRLRARAASGGGIRPKWEAVIIRPLGEHRRRHRGGLQRPGHRRWRGCPQCRQCRQCRQRQQFRQCGQCQ